MMLLMPEDDRIGPSSGWWPMGVAVNRRYLHSSFSIKGNLFDLQ
jgi:hypothetical protein